MHIIRQLANCMCPWLCGTQLANSRLFCHVCVTIWYTDSLEYSTVNVAVGESKELLCNTSLKSDVMWTYYNINVDDGYVHYVYWNERVDSNWPGLSVQATGDHSHVLGIAHAEPKHGGRYECYDAEGTRKVGYRLIVVGMRSAVIVCNLLSKTLLGEDVHVH